MLNLIECDGRGEYIELHDCSECVTRISSSKNPCINIYIISHKEIWVNNIQIYASGSVVLPRLYNDIVYHLVCLTVNGLVDFAVCGNISLISFEKRVECVISDAKRTYILVGTPTNPRLGSSCQELKLYGLHGSISIPSHINRLKIQYGTAIWEDRDTEFTLEITDKATTEETLLWLSKLCVEFPLVVQLQYNYLQWLPKSCLGLYKVIVYGARENCVIELPKLKIEYCDWHSNDNIIILVGEIVELYLYAFIKSTNYSKLSGINGSKLIINVKSYFYTDFHNYLDNISDCCEYIINPTKTIDYRKMFVN